MGRVGFDMNGDRDLESSHSRPESITLAFTNSSNPASVTSFLHKEPSPASATTSKEWLQPSSTATSRSVSVKGTKRGRDSQESTTAGETSKTSLVSGGVSGVAYLQRSVPEIAKNYQVLEKIGEGTFSSVYKACILGYPDSKVALKHLVPTSSTVRIENEIRCLQLMDGRDNVIPLMTCLRHRDHVVLVMPYFPHEKFVDYLDEITLGEVRLYMCALFQALRNVHSYHIIHRDVKPSNFLYNRQSRTFQLVDFGLAHMEPHWSKKKAEMKVKRATVNGLVPPQTYQRQRVATRRSRTSSAGSSTRAEGSASTPGSSVARGKGTKDKEQLLCPLRHREEEVCSYCTNRCQQIASRAGTSGFRAPEVLLKHPDQTTAVDVWAAGVILLCLLSGKYPFFRAHDDQSALAQIITLMGSRECSVAAKSYGKKLICVPEVDAMDLRHVCQSLRRTLHAVASTSTDRTPNLSNKRTRLFNGAMGTRASPINSPTTRHSQKVEYKIVSPRKRATRSSARVSPVKTATSSLSSIYHSRPVSNSLSDQSSHVRKSDASSMETESWSNVPVSAYYLLRRCLELNPTKRITAEQALSHPFLSSVSSSPTLR